jgi:hypothetical protein
VSSDPLISVRVILELIKNHEKSSDSGRRFINCLMTGFFPVNPDMPNPVYQNAG